MVKIALLCGASFTVTDAGVPLRYRRSIFGGGDTTKFPNMVLVGMIDQPVPMPVGVQQQKQTLAAASSAYAPQPPVAPYAPPAAPYAAAGQQTAYNQAPQQSYAPAPMMYQPLPSNMAPSASQNYMAPAMPQSYMAPSMSNQQQPTYSNQAQTTYSPAPQQMTVSYQPTTATPQLSNYVGSSMANVTSGNGLSKQEPIADSSSNSDKQSKSESSFSS